MKQEPRIDAYIANSQPFAQEILTHVRRRVHAALPEIEETIKWGMPAFTIGGKIVMLIAAFKAHAALNFWRSQEMKSTHASVGAMGQFGRLTSVADLPSEAELDQLIREAAQLSAAAPAPRKAKHPPKSPPALHPDFAAALDRTPEAKAALDSFPPSAQRDYLEWIAEAKQDVTRQKRIATAVEWLRQGKRRNWKYERC